VTNDWYWKLSPAAPTRPDEECGMIRVLVVDEERLMCAVMASVLDGEPDLSVVGSAVTPDEALEHADTCDIVLVSTSLPDNGALLVTRAIADGELPTKALVFGLGESEPEILTYIEAGAAGYVLKEASVEDLVENIRAVADGQALVSPVIARSLMERVADLVRICDDLGITVGGIAELTRRETEVLELIAEGKTNQEIADEMIIELGTVKNHVHNLLKKLNVSNRAEAARYFNLMRSVENGNGTAPSEVDLEVYAARAAG
jgi:DNA-binding NarL/FixJ family response regulator